VVKIDCSNIKNYQDFIDLFNDLLFVPAGGKWNGNLDAFNDYLSWPKSIPYHLVVIGSDNCERVLKFALSETNEVHIWAEIKEILVNNGEFVKVEFK